MTAPTRRRVTLATALCFGAQRILQHAADELDEAGVDPDFVAELAEYAIRLLDLAAALPAARRPKCDQG